jgi:hypothetical protein
MMRHLLSTGRRQVGILTVLAYLVLVPVGAAMAQPRQAKLTIKRDITCRMPTLTDHQVSTETGTFALPEIDGPVSWQGQYNHQGTGYVLSGISAGAGEVRGDAELVLTYGQWNYQGTWMKAEAPGVPSKAEPVVLPLEPGMQVTVSFQDALAVPGASCSGTVVYRIDFQRETQIWQVDLKGQRRLWNRTEYSLIDPLTGKYRDFDYEHGVTFAYRLGARVTLEKRAGAWRYESGKVTRAQVSHDYHQQPKLYKVTSRTCHGCTQIAAMAGKALSGWTDGRTLVLNWPYHAPVVTVAATFAMQCAPGPQKATCLGLVKDGGVYSDQDGKFFQRAGWHNLPLKEAQMKPIVEEHDSELNLLRLTHEYYLTRIK